MMNEGSINDGLYKIIHESYFRSRFLEFNMNYLAKDILIIKPY